MAYTNYFSDLRATRIPVRIPIQAPVSEHRPQRDSNQETLGSYSSNLPMRYPGAHDGCCHGRYPDQKHQDPCPDACQ